MEFTPITTQEEFDAAIAGRLERARAAVRREYEGYEALQSNLAAAQAQLQQVNEERNAAQNRITELEGQVQRYATDAVKTAKALEYGLPYALAGRLTGNTDEEIEADARAMAQLIGRQNPPPLPLKETETPVGEAQDAAYKQLLGDLMKGE